MRETEKSDNNFKKKKYAKQMLIIHRFQMKTEEWTQTNLAFWLGDAINM